ncbi:24318_t:CDS:2, partial [Gigaspora rosea]
MQLTLECLREVQYPAFWKNTENPTYLKFLNFRLSAGDLGDKRTETNRYNNELNTISRHYAEVSEMGQEIVNWKIVFKNDKRTKSIKQFWDFHDVGRTAEEKSRAEAPQQQYARSTTTNLLEKFLDEKKKSREDNSEDGVHVDNGEFPNSSIIALETMTDAENPFFVSGHDSDDATNNQDEPVPLKNARKRLFSETGDDLPLSRIMSVMEKYRAKSTT